jgi:hypothetical protein
VATRTIAQFANDLVRVEADYDDVNLRISAVRVINDSDFSAYVKAVRLSDGRSVDQVYAAHSNTFRSIPGNPPGERMTFTLNGGRLDGISFECLFPAL